MSQSVGAVAIKALIVGAGLVGITAGLALVGYVYFIGFYPLLEWLTRRLSNKNPIRRWVIAQRYRFGFVWGRDSQDKQLARGLVTPTHAC